MSEHPAISVVTVNHNGRHFLRGLLQSFLPAVTDGLDVEILLVDNLSTDDSVAWVRENYPDVKVIQNSVNNYCGALNLGIGEARGDYVALVNNDAELHPDWFRGLLEAFQSDERIGAVQSKILFSDRCTINSVGGEEIEGFYFKDKGFGKKDAGRYDKAGEIEYFSGGSVMFRKQCLEAVGSFDEDFIMFFEDIDFSVRVRKAGWKIRYAPRSIIYHKHHGTASNDLCDYLCTRNRFFFIVKHFPERLPESVRTSHFYQRGEFNLLYHCLLEAVRKLAECHGTASTIDAVRALQPEIVTVFGTLGAHNFFSQLELVLGLRRPRIAIYDHAFHFAGGGQRYVASMAEHLQDKYDVTYIANKDVTLDQYKEWFNIDLSKCTLKIIKIPFFERFDWPFIDESMVIDEKENPFDVVSEESLHYDVFINANMLGKVRPLSPISVFICHFPDREKERFFAVDQYDYLVSNSRYTNGWIREKWDLDATHLIYPPVDMKDEESDPEEKGSIILSVARFEQGGSKKQLEMAKAFIELAAEYPAIGQTWKLVLAGGNPVTNPYFEKVKKLVETAGCNIELKTNLSYDEVKALYKSAAIFWHACGLDEIDPRLVEHFGMTTVEAMQNYCVPIVIRGGGQIEIVEEGISGFTFSTIGELQAHTINMINDKALRMGMAKNAYRRSHEFNSEAFKTRVTALFSEIESTLMGVDTL
jgi:GT2 family glycosyltransferase/glycosyltransferase involved in cell wall biosynthesis